MGCVELWSRERGLERISAAYPPSFYMRLEDPRVYWEMNQAPDSRFRVEECSFNTIFGPFQGHRIYASRKWLGLGQEGMIFQPEPASTRRSIRSTSPLFIPPIIVKYNLAGKFFLAITFA